MPSPVITYKDHKEITDSVLLPLYNDAGWTAYTKEPKILESAVRNSLYVLTAWHADKLVGLLRIIGDGLTIVYIQDILVLKSYKRMGIGTKLMEIALQKFNSVRQKVLLTEDNDEARGFYESLGFQSADKGKLVAFVKLDNK